MAKSYRGYITAKKSNEERYSAAFPYELIVDRRSSLHPTPEDLLINMAQAISSEDYTGRLVTLRDRMPIEEKALKETLDALVKGHNMTVRLGSQNLADARKKAAKILKSH